MNVTISVGVILCLGSSLASYCNSRLSLLSLCLSAFLQDLAKLQASRICFGYQKEYFFNRKQHCDTSIQGFTFLEPSLSYQGFWYLVPVHFFLFGLVLVHVLDVITTQIFSLSGSLPCVLHFFHVKTIQLKCFDKPLIQRDVLMRNRISY